MIFYYRRFKSNYDRIEHSISPGEPVRRHQQLVKKVAAMNLNLSDPLLITLVSSIIIYTPDFLDLDQPAKAEQAQMFFASMLHR